MTQTTSGITGKLGIGLCTNSTSQIVETDNGIYSLMMQQCLQESTDQTSTAACSNYNNGSYNFMVNNVLTWPDNVQISINTSFIGNGTGVNISNLTLLDILSSAQSGTVQANSTGL